MDDSALARLEYQRLELEKNIAKLRKALRHWQTLEIDYQGLQEELIGLPADATEQESLNALQEFGAELVDEKELRALFVVGRNNPHQVADVLAKRVEYVLRNIETVRKQLSAAEKKRNALLLAEEPDHREEAGLPLTEITEEFDADGNVVSAKLETSKSATPQLVEVLRKAGVTGLVDDDGIVKVSQEVSGTPMKAETAGQESDSHSSSNLTQTQNGAAAQRLSEPPADDTLLQIPEALSRSSIPSEVESRNITEPKTSVLTNDLPASQSHTFVSQNLNDTEEEARLRQEMLQYGLGEVGAIVAELDLEEGTSDVSYEEDGDLSMDSDFHEEEDDDEEDQEDSSDDETGKTKNPTIPDAYRRRMERLQKDLAAKGMLNVGPSPDLSQEAIPEVDKPPAAVAAGKAAIARAEALKEAEKNAASTKMETKSKKASKKKVAFAETLDIAPVSKTAMNQSSAEVQPPEKSKVNPMGEVVVERDIGSFVNPAVIPSSQKTKKDSRFKSARTETAAEPTVPHSTSSPTSRSSSGHIINDTLVERPANPRSIVSAPDPDEIDEELHHKQIAGEYYKMRNRMIYQQGGFVGDGEADNYGEAIAPLPFEDEETGQVKKVSRFKAARLK